MDRELPCALKRARVLWSVIRSLNQSNKPVRIRRLDLAGLLLMSRHDQLQRNIAMLKIDNHLSIDNLPSARPASRWTYEGVRK
jgi:hypothetical protein